jgi:hypothetical protein
MDLGKNTYTQVSINKILELLSEFYGVQIKRSWLFQCLRYLEDNGLINRKRRYLNLEGGLIRSKPSLWSFPLKGVNWLFKRSVVGAALFRKNILLWLKKKDGRFPTERDFYGPPHDQTDHKAVERLKQLAAIATKDMP